MPPEAPHVHLPSESYRDLYRLARRLLEAGNEDESFDRVVEETLHLVGADRGFLVLRAEDGLDYRVARNWSDDELRGKDGISSSIVRHVLQSDEAIVVPDALLDERFSAQVSVIELQVRSVLAAPIRTGSDAQAVIYLESRSQDTVFDEVHLEMFKQVLAMAGDLLEANVAFFLRSGTNRSALDGFPFEGLMTRNPTFRAALEVAARVAPTDLPVLVQGPSGTGKELVIRALHAASQRHEHSLETINCGAIAATLLDSELFGHVRGAFTGAHKDRPGLLQSAHRGTLFLDEIGELPIELQPKLLRAMQFGEVRPVGAEAGRRVDVRVLAATNRNLAEDVRNGDFREDLLYRLNAVTIDIPPLCARREDILPLFHHFLDRYSTGSATGRPSLGPGVEETVLAYDWPGNVRELENEVQRAIALSSGVIAKTHLSPRLVTRAGEAPPDVSPGLSLAESEKRLIEYHLRANGGNRTHTAEALGISREGLRKKMMRLDIQYEGDD